MAAAGISSRSSSRRAGGSHRQHVILVAGLAALLGFAVGILVATMHHPELAGGGGSVISGGGGGSSSSSNIIDASSPSAMDVANRRIDDAPPNDSSSKNNNYATAGATYAPPYHIIGVRVESRKHLPASTRIPNTTGTVHWHDVPMPINSNNDNSQLAVNRRIALQRRHMIEALERYLPVACPTDEEWFLWIEDDVVPYEGSLLRVQGIILAIRQRYGTEGFEPAYVRLGVGLTAALLRCGDTHARLLPRLKTSEQEQGQRRPPPEGPPVDQIVANAFRLPKGRTLNYETGLFGHSDAQGVSSTIQRSSAGQHGSRSGNEYQKLILSTNLAGPRFAFDVGGCLGYVWSPCPARGGVWAPMSSLDWFGGRGDDEMDKAQPRQPRFMVVHGKDIGENCDAACHRYGTQCDEEGLVALNDPLTFRERSGVACDGVYYRTAAHHLPAFDPRYAGESDAPDGPITACYLNLRTPSCGGKISAISLTMSPRDKRVCACSTLSISHYDELALGAAKLHVDIATE